MLQQLEKSVSCPYWAFGNLWLLSTLCGRLSKADETNCFLIPTCLFLSEALDQYKVLGIFSHCPPQAPAFILPSFQYTSPSSSLTSSLSFLLSCVYLRGPGAACLGLVFSFWQLPEAQVKTKASFCQSLYEYMIRHIPCSEDLLI